MSTTPIYDPSADHSSLRESILEHTFLGTLGRELWRRGRYSVEVLRAEVDRAGYDVVISVDNRTRYIQLKSLSKGATTREWSISNLLTEKTGGCIVVQSVDRFSLDVEAYLFFGGSPTERLPDISQGKPAKRVTFDSQGVRPVRKNHRRVPKSRFETIPNMEALASRLFDLAPNTATLTANIKTEARSKRP